MKLIIDIPEGIYKHVDIIQNGSIGAKQIINSVKNGIPAYKAIPSAEPKTGRWIHYEGMLICSECGIEFYDDIMEYCGDDVPKCCPDCGRRMFEPQKGDKEWQEKKQLEIY